MNQLAELAQIMIALRDPAKAAALVDALAVNNPEVMLELAGKIDLVKVAKRVDPSLSFPMEFISEEVFKKTEWYANGYGPIDPSRGGHFNPKIEAIKYIRSETGAGLKEAKDFVEFYFPLALSGA